MSLQLRISPQPLALAPLAAPQLAYALVHLAADAGAGAAPIHWAVVADASRSMRIPIVSEEQFRELVRSGGASEVLVDGLPVWQLNGPVPEAIRATAPSALEHTARALHSIIERLDQADRLVLVACAEEALLLVAADGDRRAALVAGVARLASLRLGEATDLALGLELALAELEQHGAEANGSGRVLLLTDGFTRDSEACLELARAAALGGISISTIGLGGEFQDDLLTRMADLSGGRAVYVRHAEAIPPVVAAELEAARGVAAAALSLELALPRNVSLHRVTRMSPSLAPLEWSELSPGRLQLHLGDLERGVPVRLLLEVLAPALPPQPVAAGPRMRLAALTARSGTAEARADLVAHYTPMPTSPPAAVLDAAARAAVARLQIRARAAAAVGETQRAATLLRQAALRLHELGESALAAAAAHEAEALAITGHISGATARELTYATRRLGEG